MQVLGQSSALLKLLKTKQRGRAWHDGRQSQPVGFGAVDRRDGVNREEIARGFAQGPAALAAAQISGFS